MDNVIKEAQDFKEKGNEAFRNYDWDDAVKFYTKAINLVQSETNDLAVFLKNRAAAYLKQDRFDEAIRDCDAALEIAPNDPKALFRRSQALESLERYEEAYRDAKQVLVNDPTNKAIQPVLERLHKIVQERASQQSQMSFKIDSTGKTAFDMAATKEKRETAMNNLLVLSRNKSAADLIIKSGAVTKIKQLVKVEKDQDIKIAAIRTVGELCKDSVERTKAVLKEAGVPWFLEVLDSNNEEQVNTVQHCMQIVLNAFSGMNMKEAKPKKELLEKHKKQIDTLLSCLVYSIDSRVISGLARDAIMELIMRNVIYSALDWAERFVEIGGVQRLMEVASELEDYKYESSLYITKSSQTIAAVCLSRVYDNMGYDQARNNFINKIEDFIKDKLLNPDIESKVRVVAAITALLRGPFDVGNSVIGKEGIMEMILVMANTDDVLQQKVACECIIAAASKQDKAKAILNQGIDILKKLYKSDNDAIRVRALVGLCKLGSSGGTDASVQPFAEGSMLKLAEACRRFLLHPSKDQSMQKWAVEGYSYLTLDAEVKEKLVNDKAALKAMIELAKTGDQSVLYGVVTTLVNLCNAYEKQEVIPEMIELAKFAKQHIPEEHELDDPDFVMRRIEILGKEGTASALVALSKTESPFSKELISRVFNALCSDPELRGYVVQQGGVKALLAMAKEGTDKGKRQASQALARIAITTNPEVAFPGQRCLEVVRPLISLLHPDCSGLENFEALLGLCNIAQVGEEARQRIIKEGGIAKIDHYMYEDHELLCRASTQVMTNMLMSPDIVKIYEGNNDRTKYLLMLCGEQDVDTVMAASGALAILTDSSKKCCAKLFELEKWLDYFHALLANPNPNIQYRGVYIVNNIIESSIDLAKKLIETDVMEILMALQKSEEPEKEQIRKYASLALKAAQRYDLIMKTEDAPSTSSQSSGVVITEIKEDEEKPGGSSS